MADNEFDDDLITVVVGDERVEPTPAVEQWDVDPVCAQAVDVARTALIEEAGAAVVGEPCGLVADGPLVVTHYFEGRVPGYAGWRWAVTLTRAPDSDHVTVDETALLPDGDALLAPAWVPWKKRVQAGDLGAGDVLVTESEDARLVPGMSGADLPEDDEDLRPVQWELGLGRVRVLSPEGRRDAAQRWYREVGPRSSVARATDLKCGTCGFLLLMGGPLGQAFGVCANGYSPADGRVVAFTFGCGAHSETVQGPTVGVAETVVDEVGYDELGPLPDEPEAAAEDAPGETLDEPEAAAEDAPGETPDAGADSLPAPSPDEDHGTMQEPGSEEDA